MKWRSLLPAMALLACGVVQAQQPARPGGDILLGAGVWSRPAYDGASGGQTLALIPSVRYYGPVAFARTTMGLLEGGARTVVAEGLTLGVQLAYEGGRSRAESEFLAAHALDDLPLSLSWGAHAEFERMVGPMPLIGLLRWRQDVDAARGAQLDLRLTAGVLDHAGWQAGVFVQRTWANASAANYYYGLTPAQAVASGLPAHATGGGALFDALGLLWSCDLAPRWLLLGSFEGRQLRSAAQDSPLAQAQNSGYASVSLARRF